MAKADNVVTVVAKFDEMLDTAPTVSIAGATDNVTVLPNGEALEYTATKTLVSGSANDGSYSPAQVAVVISNIKDRAGNAISNITNANISNYVIFDETAPTLAGGTSDLVITEAVNFDNDADTKYAKSGETVSIAFVTSEALGDAAAAGFNNITATIGGLTATVTGGGSGVETQYTITRLLDDNVADGALAIAIDFEDIAGNPVAATVTHGDLDGSNVTFDKTDPVITIGDDATDFVSNNSTTTLAKKGDIVSVVVEIGEPIYSITSATMGTTVDGTYTGNAISNANINAADPATPNPGRKTWTLQYAMTGGEGEGPVNYAFTVNDYAGNSASNAYTDVPSDADLTVTFDKTLQPLALATIVSDNADVTRAKQGDAVSLTVESGEALGATPTVTIGGNAPTTTTVLTANLKWKFDYAMTLTDNEGVVATSIVYSDIAGNSNNDGESNDSYADAAYTARTDGTSVTYDRTKPYFVADANCADCAVTMGSIDNLSDTHASIGDRVRLSFTASEELLESSMTSSIIFGGSLQSDLSGTGNALTAAGSGRVWTADRTLGIVGNEDQEGTLYFSIAATDLAGNSLAATQTALTTGPNIIYDKTVPATPTMVLSSDNSNNSGSDLYAILDDIITLSITTANDVVEPVVTIAGTAVDLTNDNPKSNWVANYTVAADATADADNKVQFSITLRDEAYNETVVALRNSGTDATNVVFLDLVKPNITDDGTYISVVSDNDYNTELARPTDVITVKMKFSEELGSDPVVKILNKTIADVTGPDADGAYTAALTVSANEDDNGGAGTVINNATSDNTILSITQVKDGAGNQTNPTEFTAVTTGTVTFDKTAPEFSTGNGIVMTSDGTDHDLTDEIIYAKQGDKVKITITATEAILNPTSVGTGNISMMGTTGDITCTAVDGVDAFECVKELTAGHSAGAVSFSVLINDLSGNQSAITKSAVETNGNVVHYDKTAPTIASISFTSSDNAVSTAYAVPGNSMLLTFATDEKIQAPTVTIAGAPADVTNASAAGVATTDKKNWRAVYTLTGDETFDNTTTPSRVPFNIAYKNYADIDGVTETHARYVTVYGGAPVEYDSDAPALSVVSFQNTENSDGEAVINALYARQGSKVTLLIDSNEDLDATTITATVCGLDESAATNPPIVTLISDADGNANRRIKVTKVLGTQATEIASLDANNFIDFSIFARNTFGFAIAENITKLDITGNSITYDRAIPTIDAFSISSSGGQDMVGGVLYAKSGDNVTVTVTANEDLNTPVISIGAFAVPSEITITNDDGNAKVWTAVYEMGDAAAGTDQDGTIAVTMTYTDLAGNQGATKTQADLANLMTYDKINPSFKITNTTQTTITSNNTGSNSSITAGTRAKVGDNITLGFKITDVGGIPNPTITLGGNTEDIVLTGPTVVGNVSTYSANYNTIPDITAATFADTIEFLISITDHAGNTSTYTNVNLGVDGGSNVVFDNTAPVISSLTIASSTPAYSDGIDYAKVDDQVTLSFAVAENDAILTGKPVLVIAKDLCTNDNGGNAVVMSLSNDVNGNGSWDTGDSWGATYTIQSTDDECAANNGRLKFKVYVDDIAGNRSEVKTDTDPVDASGDPVYVVFDKTAPAVDTDNVAEGCKIFCNTVGTLSARHVKASTASLNETVKLQVTFLEKVKSPTFLIEGKTPSDANITTVDNLTWNAQVQFLTSDAPAANNDTIAFTVNFEDFAGNTGTEYSTTTNGSYVIFDKTPPTAATLSITSNNPWDNYTDASHPYDPNLYAITGSTVTLTTIADESLLSILCSLRTAQPASGDVYTVQDAVSSSNDDKTWASSYTMQAVDLEGAVTFKIVLTDSAGNESDTLRNADITNGTSIEYDASAPVATNIVIALDSGSDTGIDNADKLTNLVRPKFDITDSGGGLTTGDSVLLLVDDVVFYREVVGVGVSAFSDIELDSDMSHEVNTGHEIIVKLRDPAGNLSDASPKITVKVDTEVPTVGATVPDLLAVDDTGWADDDNITNDKVDFAKTPVENTRFLITGLSTATDSIDLFAVGINPVSASEKVASDRKDAAVEDTIWMDIPISSGGKYGFYYVLSDDAGNSSINSDTARVVFDFIAPVSPGKPNVTTLTDLGQLDNDDVTNSDTVKIDINYQEAFSDGQLWRVRFNPINGLMEDGTLYDTSQVDPVVYSDSSSKLVRFNGTKRYNMTNEITDGDSARIDYYPITVDSAGNETEGNDITIWYDYKDPTGVVTYSDVDTLIWYGNSAVVCTLTFNEPLSSINPQPTITLEYPPVIEPAPGTAAGGGVIRGPFNLIKISDKQWRHTIDLDDPAYDDVNGLLKISVTAYDVAGNAVLSENLNGEDSLRFDNTKPEFIDPTPVENSYIRDLKAFSWMLTEELQSGFVKLVNQTSAAESDITYSLKETELTTYGYPTTPDTLLNMKNPNPGTLYDPRLIDGHKYNITYQGVDIAGNTGTVTVENVTFDTTRPTASLSFEKLFASGEATVVCTMKFSEPMLATPKIGINYGGAFSGNDIDSTLMSSTSDASIWLYTATMPTGILNQGIVQFGIYAKDYATNKVLNDSVYIAANDSLYLDNTVATATLSYKNITQPEIFVKYPSALSDTMWNAGKGGDVIQIKVEMNEPILTDPPPGLTLKYNSGAGSTETYQPTPDSSTYGDSIWYFDNIVLLDAVDDDGALKVEIQARDRSLNGVNNYGIQDIDGINTSTDTLFKVDNIAPALFDLSVVRLSNVNPSSIVTWDDLTSLHQDMDNDPLSTWYNKRVTHFYMNVPLPPFNGPQRDTTMHGGSVRIDFQKLNGTILDTTDTTDGSNGTYKVWAQIGNPDTLDPTSDFGNKLFFRDSLTANNVILRHLALGDSLVVRACQTDIYGNETCSDPASIHKFFYDRVPMNVGTFSGGNIINQESLISTDTISVQWNPFIDPGGVGASGFWKYTFTIARHIERESLGDTLSDTLMRGYYGTQGGEAYEDILWQNWNEIETADNNAIFVFDSPSVDTLKHKEMYEFLLFAQDLAGNMSDTISSGMKYKYNSKPVLSNVDPWTMNEDGDYTDFHAIRASDIDSLTFQGDNVLYSTWTFQVSGAGDTIWSNHPVDINNNILSYLPVQSDVGNWTVRVIAEDNTQLKDTTEFSMEVVAVNDAPELAFVNSMGFLIKEDSVLVFSFEEDSQIMDTLNLTKYVSDVDNNDTTEITWQWVILDTNQLGKPYPMGQVFFGPGTDPRQKVKLMKEFMGVDPSGGINFTKKNKPKNKRDSRWSVLDKSSTSGTHPITINDSSFTSDETYAVFNSESNYYGDEHRVIFIVQDPFVPGDPNSQLEDRDTIIVSVIEKNDSPVMEEIGDWTIPENDSLVLDLSDYASDVDDSVLTFIVKALTNPEYMTILPDSFLSSGVGDSVIIKPQPLWSAKAQIQVIAKDEAAQDTSTFLLDIERARRPAPSISIVQNNVFSHYLDIVIIDTVQKTVDISFEIQSESMVLDTVAPYTYTSNFNFGVEKSYSFEVQAEAVVGDTLWGSAFVLALAKSVGRWIGSSSDGSFTVAGETGSVSSDQPLLIVDSTLFSRHFAGKASYIVGNENYQFKAPVRVSLTSRNTDRALYNLKNGSWVELPSVSVEGTIITYSEKAGYYRLGPKTIIVPEVTSLHPNYPNPFNPVTNIRYDIGLLDGLKQNVSINIYNIIGQRIRSVVKNMDQLGQYTVQWDGRNEMGKDMPTGIYFVQLSTSTGIVKNLKMMLLK